MVELMSLADWNINDISNIHKDVVPPNTLNDISVIFVVSPLSFYHILLETTIVLLPTHEFYHSLT